MFQVFPITETKVDWNTYLIQMKKIFGRSITEQLDKQGTRPESLSSFLVTLGNILEPDLKPQEILTSGGLILKHAFYGFAIILETDLLVELMTTTSLNVMSVASPHKNYRLAIVTGTLEQWHTSIINVCSATADPELRAIFDTCMTYMERAGLSMLWWNYAKTTLNDKTFVLTEKR